MQAKVPYRNFIFFLNIMMVIDNIIIKKGTNYFLNDRKSTAKSMYYLHSRSVNDKRHSLKLTLKFQYGTFSKIDTVPNVTRLGFLYLFLYTSAVPYIWKSYGCYNVCWGKAMTMFTVLWCCHHGISHFESSPGSFNKCRTAPGCHCPFGRTNQLGPLVYRNRQTRA